MKQLLGSLIVVGLSLTAHSQGTVSFSDYWARVYEADGVTRLSGPQFQAGLLAGPSATSLASIATTGFLTGNAAGFFDGGTQTINTVLPGNEAWIQVRAWNTALGASFLQAEASGLPNAWWESPLMTVFTGGVLSGAGPTPPAVLFGLGTSPVYLNVPEPSAFALAALGASVVLVRIWRKTPTFGRVGSRTGERL